MINYEEARALKFFFMGLNKSLLQTVNIPKPVINPMKELIIFEIAYERISLTTDVFMELVDFIGRQEYDPINLKSPLELTRQVCYALDLFPLFWETDYSSLKYKTNYLIKEGHLKYYFELVAALDAAVKEHFTPIDISKYIMAGQK